MVARAVLSLVPTKRALKKLLGAPFTGVWNLYLGKQSFWMTGKLVCTCGRCRSNGVDRIAGMVVSDVQGDHTTEWRE